jgi:RNA polymerase subunit RPABC4/transcription elongation factor Spt4
MSLIKCPECYRDVSDRAEKCPQCGCPITEMKRESVVVPAQGTYGLKANADKGSHYYRYYLRCQDCKSYFMVEKCFNCGNTNGFYYGQKAYGSGIHTKLHKFMICDKCNISNDSFSCPNCGRHNSYSGYEVIYTK